MDEQLAFDIEGMIREAQIEAAPPWTGAPLHFTTDYHSATDLEAAFEHWQFLHGRFNSYAESRMWHRAIAAPGGATATGNNGEHGFDLFTADLRCEPWKHPDPRSDVGGGCACVGELIYQAICEPCEWHSIGGEENTAVEAWHDHAFPGWRELPIVPARIKIVDSSMRLTNQAREWVEEHYPSGAQRPGAPIITERSGLGTRHVPGRSPWGGYDISHALGLDPKREPPKPARPVGVVASRRPAALAPQSPTSPDSPRRPGPTPMGMTIGG